MVITYKALDSNFSCRGFKYKVGEKYHKNYINMCSQGFHSCGFMMDIFRYYMLCNNECKLTRFAKVEISGDIITEENKSCSSDIEIIEEITINDIMNEYMNVIKKDTTKNKRRCVDNSNVATCSNYSNIVNTGRGCNISNSGINSTILNSGSCANIHNSGNETNIYSNGTYTNVMNCGDWCSIVCAEYEASVHDSGYSNKIIVLGKNTHVILSGQNSTISGVLGTKITYIEYASDASIVGVKYIIIDGITYKENTPYKLCNNVWRGVVE